MPLRRVIVALGVIFASSLITSASPTSSSSDTIDSILSAKFNKGVTIKYKTPRPGTCETFFKDQKQYTGYVSLPPSTLKSVTQSYPINTFFWLVESRIDPKSAPLTVYLNGGPGSTSLVGLFQETGPCEAIETAKNQIGTRPREWGWDRSSNMLYIDQPVQSGFSFDQLRRGSLNLLNSSYTFPPSDPPKGQSKATWLEGVTSSNDVQSTSNTTSTSAKALWHALQTILTEFPQYRRGSAVSDNKRDRSASINIFAESYGGKYAPGFVTHIEQQNTRRRRGEIPISETLEINVKSLGIMQGCIDDLVQNPYFPIFAHNNSYGISAASLKEKDMFLDHFNKAGGCRDSILDCRREIQSSDPDNTGGVGVVNDKCLAALANCLIETPNLYSNIGRSGHDITQSNLDPFPPHTYLEYLNSKHVQKSIGVSMNLTDYSSTVASAFLTTADYDRGDYITDLAKLLDSGMRVALIYGDKDYVCNWMGGQAVAFSIAAASSSYRGRFNAAGYAPLIVNDTYIGGMVRQSGNLSFTRIYDAGHLIPAYQPETLYTLFDRVIRGGTDLSTGKPVDSSAFNTRGDANTTATNSVPPMAKPTCYIRKIGDTCTQEQTEKLAKGKGTIINDVWYESESDWKKPLTTVEKDGQRNTHRRRRDGKVATAFVALSTPAMVGQRSVKLLHE